MRRTSFAGLTGLAMALSVAASARSARAQAQPSLVPKTQQIWKDGAEREFVSASVVAGNLLRTVLGVGLGQPHWRSLSLETAGSLAPSYAQGAAYFSAALPLVQLQVGMTYQRMWSSGSLPRLSHYSQDELDAHPGHADFAFGYVALLGRLPLGHFITLLRVELLDAPWVASAVLEPRRFVLRPPLAAFTQAFPMLAFGEQSWLRAGLVVEGIWPGGGAPGIVRLGPCVSLDLTEHTDLLALLEAPVTSPDALGLKYGAYGGMVARYRWASGEQTPGFP